MWTPANNFHYTHRFLPPQPMFYPSYPGYYPAPSVGMGPQNPPSPPMPYPSAQSSPSTRSSPISSPMPPPQSQPPKRRLRVFVQVHNQGITQAHCPSSQPARTAPQRRPPGAPWNYKMALCRHFLHTGSCPKRNECRFAHGEHELILRPDQPINYKTEPCKQFALGKCEFGVNCHFAH